MTILWIAGLGPGDAGKITKETIETMERADKVILRTEIHPAAAGLAAMGIRYISCDPYYESGESFQAIYGAIAAYVWAEAEKASVCYCVPGHPLVAEETVRLLLAKAAEQDQARQDQAGQGRAGQSREGQSQAGQATEPTRAQASASPASAQISPPVLVRVLPAVSFLDAAFVALGIDPVGEKLAILDASCLYDGDRRGLLPLPQASCLFAQVYDLFIAGELKLALLEEVSPDAEALILYHAGMEGEEELSRCPLAELDHYKKYDHLTSVYLPLASRSGKSGSNTAACRYPLDALMEVMRRLLGPDGCPWDRKQTHTSLRPYLLEEAGEAAEAIDEGDMPHLAEELGDVLMQIAFHSVLAEGRGDFDINDVIAGITEKMIRRHPHVFGGERAGSPEEVMVLWQKIKEEERNSKNMT